jgi:hypothetical protein
MARPSGLVEILPGRVMTSGITPRHRRSIDPIALTTSAIGTKRTWGLCRATSAFRGEADISSAPIQCRLTSRHYRSIIGRPADIANSNPINIAVSMDACRRLRGSWLKQCLKRPYQPGWSPKYVRGWVTTNGMTSGM